MFFTIESFKCLAEEWDKSERVFLISHCQHILGENADECDQWEKIEEMFFWQEPIENEAEIIDEIPVLACFIGFQIVQESLAPWKLDRVLSLSKPLINLVFFQAYYNVYDKNSSISLIISEKFQIRILPRYQASRKCLVSSQRSSRVLTTPIWMMCMGSSRIASGIRRWFPSQQSPLTPLTWSIDLGDLFLLLAIASALSCSYSSFVRTWIVSE